jgi:hypothetical protein
MHSLGVEIRASRVGTGVGDLSLFYPIPSAIESLALMLRWWPRRRIQMTVAERMEACGVVAAGRALSVFFRHMRWGWDVATDVQKPGIVHGMQWQVEARRQTANDSEIVQERTHEVANGAVSQLRLYAVRQITQLWTRLAHKLIFPTCTWTGHKGRTPGNYADTSY